MKKRMNGNYEILENHKVLDSEIVLGYCNQSGFYVCWSCYNDNDYRAGYYSENYSDVKEEYINRIGH